MNDKQIVKAALTRTGTTQAALSGKIGYANKTSLATMLSRPSNLRMDVLFKILDALGFEIVIRPKNKDDKTEWLLADNENPIETKLYAPDIEAIRASMKPPCRKE